MPLHHDLSPPNKNQKSDKIINQHVKQSLGSQKVDILQTCHPLIGTHESVVSLWNAGICGSGRQKRMILVA